MAGIELIPAPAAALPVGTTAGTVAAGDDARFVPAWSKWKGGRGYYYGAWTGSRTTTVLAGDQLKAMAVYIGNAVTIDRLSINVVAAGDAGSVCRLGIYADNNGVPDALVLDAGTVTTGSTGIKEATVNQALPAGTYWFGAVGQTITAAPTLTGDGGFAAIPAFARSNGDAFDTPEPCVVATGGVSGALPASFGSSPGTTLTGIRVAARAA